EAHAVIRDRAPDAARLVIDPNAHASRAGMLHDVEHSLLDDAIERCLHDRGETPAGGTVHTHVEPATLYHPLGQALEGRNEPEIVQHGWTKLGGETPQVVGTLIETAAALRDAVPARGRHLARDVSQRKLGRDDQLPRLVVDFMGQPLRL